MSLRCSLTPQFVYPCYAGCVRRLIINADDFGYTAGVNRAIIDAHTRGVVTSSTLMANGPSFSEAVQLASSVPKLSIGCHIVLIDGVPLTAPHQVRTLTNGDAQFRDGLRSFAARALAGRLSPDEIAAEATAQIRNLQNAGITVSHF